VSKY